MHQLDCEGKLSTKQLVADKARAQHLQVDEIVALSESAVEITGDVILSSLTAEESLNFFTML